MKKFIKENWKFLLIVLIGGIIGGYCTGLYSYDILSEDMLRQLQEQNISIWNLVWICSCNTRYNFI